MNKPNIKANIKSEQWRNVKTAFDSLVEDDEGQTISQKDKTLATVTKEIHTLVVKMEYSLDLLRAALSRRVGTVGEPKKDVSTLRDGICDISLSTYRRLETMMSVLKGIQDLVGVELSKTTHPDVE